jgi:hypothetical protein
MVGASGNVLFTTASWIKIHLETTHFQSPNANSGKRRQRRILTRLSGRRKHRSGQAIRVKSIFSKETDMASKAMIGNTDPMQPETAVEKERRHRIQHVNRKYEFVRTRFICSAGNNPAELEDWLQAECELTS